MRSCSVTKLAEWDMKAIARYIAKSQGSAESKRYVQGLWKCFQLIASDPTLGRRSEAVLPGLRRIEYSAHVFFYATEAKRVVIARVLPRHLIPGIPQP